MKQRILSAIFFLLWPALLKADPAPAPLWSKSEASQIPQVVFDMTKIMIHDVTDPPAASRFYAYASLAGYEVACENSKGMPSMKSLLNQYPALTRPPGFPKQYTPLSALYAMAEVAKNIMPSGYEMEQTEQRLLEWFREEKGLDEAQLKDSREYAEYVAGKITAYANADGYFKLSTYTRYTPKDQPGYWFPTPPGYFAAVRPHWNTLRPFFLDSASEFIPFRPAAFSTDTATAFFQLAKGVYDTGRNLTKEQMAIADFWDCNPFALEDQGHLSIGFKKISPGGHWMAIAGLASAQRQLNFDQTMCIHALTAVALADAFISCWDEKFRSERIRPETVINRYIDEHWKPYLQTPPFPEYTSGHGCISSSAAHVLTYLLGDNFAFKDTTEQFFGLPPRSFPSFVGAADEAAVSRFYGGIHYMDSVEKGLLQGKKVAVLFIKKLEAAGIGPIKE